jgi:hypothetical protein
MNNSNYDTNSFKRADSKKSYDSTRTQVKEAPAEVKSRSKKDTKKWCKGVVGREHQWAWVYREALPNCRWNRWGQTEKIIEPPLPTLEEEKKIDRHRWNAIPRAQQICLVCQKHKGWGENSFSLRRQGIKIHTELPD